jgi:hypothetical protein
VLALVDPTYADNRTNAPWCRSYDIAELLNCWITGEEKVYGARRQPWPGLKLQLLLRLIDLKLFQNLQPGPTPSLGSREGFETTHSPSSNEDTNNKDQLKMPPIGPSP